MNLPLVNAERMHEQHPDTFHVQPLDERNALRAGDFAKICLHAEGEAGERFWVEILRRWPERYGRVLYEGKVNSPIDREQWGLGEGDPIAFGSEHVYDSMSGFVARGGLLGAARRLGRRLLGKGAAS